MLRVHHVLLHLVIFAVFALSTSAIFVKLADAPPAITAFYRLFFAMLVLLPFLLAQKSLRQELTSLSKTMGTRHFIRLIFVLSLCVMV